MRKAHRLLHGRGGARMHWRKANRLLRDLDLTFDAGEHSIKTISSSDVDLIANFAEDLVDSARSSSRFTFGVRFIN